MGGRTDPITPRTSTWVVARLAMVCLPPAQPRSSPRAIHHARWPGHHATLPSRALPATLGFCARGFLGDLIGDGDAIVTHGPIGSQFLRHPDADPTDGPTAA